jgi:hypothetical protein
MAIRVVSINPFFAGMIAVRYSSLSLAIERFSLPSYCPLAVGAELLSQN